MKKKTFALIAAPLLFLAGAVLTIIIALIIAIGIDHAFQPEGKTAVESTENILVVIFGPGGIIAVMIGHVVLMGNSGNSENIVPDGGAAQNLTTQPLQTRETGIQARELAIEQKKAIDMYRLLMEIRDVLRGINNQPSNRKNNAKQINRQEIRNLLDDATRHINHLSTRASRYLLPRVIFVGAIIFSVAHVFSNMLAAVATRMYTDSPSTADIPLPWYIEFFHNNTMIVLSFIIGCAVSYYYARHTVGSDRFIPLSLIGMLSAFVPGIIFLAMLGFETTSSLIASRPPDSIWGALGISVFDWMVVQRMVFFPMAGLLGSATTWIVLRLRVRSLTCSR